MPFQNVQKNKIAPVYSALHSQPPAWKQGLAWSSRSRYILLLFCNCISNKDWETARQSAFENRNFSQQIAVYLSPPVAFHLRLFLSKHHYLFSPVIIYARPLASSAHSRDVHKRAGGKKKCSPRLHSVLNMMQHVSCRICSHFRSQRWCTAALCCCAALPK